MGLKTERLGVLADAGKSEGVNRGDARLLIHRRIKTETQPVLQFSGGLVSEGDRADAARHDALFHEPADALGQNPRFPGPSPGDQNGRLTYRMLYRCCLFF